MTHQSHRYDAIVVGLGGMGSATLHQLARRGKRVLGIERFQVPNEMGSSHGITRIIRLAYFEQPAYVSLLRRAYELWRDLESISGERLLHVIGSIDAGRPGTQVFDGSVASCRLHDLPHEILTSAELNRRFPGYRLPADMMAVLQPDGGFLVPERCIVSAVRAAGASGAEVHTEERVLDWQPIAGGVSVRSDRGNYEADQLVLTAGAWVSDLADPLRRHLEVERQVLIWIEPLQPDWFVPGRFPVFNIAVDEGDFYGFPAFQIPGFKFGRFHHPGGNTHPDVLDRNTNPRDEAPLRAFAARYFPLGAGRTLGMKTCMFTSTRDENFILDRHPEHPQVILASACSGHGFKFCTVVGEILADLVERGDTRHDIEMFRLARFSEARSFKPQT